MAYEVKITPGRDKEKKFELDEALKAGCDEAAKYGTRILVYGDPRCGKTSVLKYFISKASDYFGVDESDVLYMDDVEFIGMTTPSSRVGSMEDFRKRFLDAKMIVLDDINFCVGKVKAEDELKQIFEMDKIFIVSMMTPQPWMRFSKSVENQLEYFTKMEINKSDNINE